MIEGLSPIHLVLILVIALIVIGPGKLPEVGGAIGKSIREFRKASSGEDDASPAPAQQAAPAPVAPVQAPVAPIAAAPAVVAPAVQPVAAPVAPVQAAPMAAPSLPVETAPASDEAPPADPSGVHPA